MQSGLLHLVNTHLINHAQAARAASGHCQSLPHTPDYSSDEDDDGGALRVMRGGEVQPDALTEKLIELASARGGRMPKDAIKLAPAPRAAHARALSGDRLPIARGNGGRGGRQPVRPLLRRPWELPAEHTPVAGDGALVTVRQAADAAGRA